MKTLFTKESKVAEQPVSVPVQPTRKPYDLTDLYDELGRFNWAGADTGWEKAISAVREEIKKMVRMNKLGT